MAEMVRVALQNRERPVELFEEDHAGELMGQSHFAERQDEVGGFAGFAAETVSGTNGDQQRGGALLDIVQPAGKLLGRKLLSLAIEKQQCMPRTGIAGAEFKQSRFVFYSASFNLCIVAQTLEIFLGQPLDLWLPGSADPCDFDFHEED